MKRSATSWRFFLMEVCSPRRRRRRFLFSVDPNQRCRRRQCAWPAQSFSPRGSASVVGFRCWYRGVDRLVAVRRAVVRENPYGPHVGVAETYLFSPSSFLSASSAADAEPAPGVPATVGLLMPLFLIGKRFVRRGSLSRPNPCARAAMNSRSPAASNLRPRRFSRSNRARRRCKGRLSIRCRRRHQARTVPSGAHLMPARGLERRHVQRQMAFVAGSSAFSFAPNVIGG